MKKLIRQMFPPRRLRLFLCVSIAAMALATVATVESAYAMRPAGRADAAAVRADSIVVGRVTAKRSFWDTRSGKIMSRVTLKVAETAAGSTPGSGTVDFTVPGGTVGNVSLAVSDTPRFEAGGKVKLWLSSRSGQFAFVKAVDVDGPDSPAALGYGATGLRWPTASLPLRYRVNTTNGDVADGDAVLAAVNGGFSAWEDDSGSFMDYAYSGATTKTGSIYDGENVVSWVPSIDSGALAVCWTWYSGSNILENDIEFNDSYPWGTSGSGSAYDIQNVATHETGHTLKLDDLYDAADSEETMYGYAALGETKKRTLYTGDIAGIRFLYPDTAGPTATINAPRFSTEVTNKAIVPLTWSGSDAGGSGLSGRYQIQYMIKSSAYPWQVWKTITGTSVDFPVRPGRYYYFRVRAEDNAGSWGAWSPYKRTIVPYNETQIKYRSGFGGYYSNVASRFYLGTVRYSRTAGEWMSFTTNTTRFAVIGTGGNRSKFDVYIDGRFIRTVDPARRTGGHHQVLYEYRFPSVGRHTIKIVNQATPGRTQFDMDGIGAEL